ncbi:PepSY-associated TM helix domain-containing protein [Seinonella peptonophila]|uniref:PepSY-associated TM helix domain-containing protein n=1 Tax=Seinonella peptonophila TaxID=112248 RepID=UPI001FEC5DD9|nr:PepSY domain-containing protein [Seinonella peptonophila]
MGHLLRREKEGGSTSFYQVVWRWHFYAGIIFTPFLIILAISGATYLFKPQIESIIYKDKYYVHEQGSSTLSPSEQVKKVKKSYPKSSVTSFTIYHDPKRTTEIGLIQGGKSVSVYINPYNGQIQGTLKEDDRFTEIFKKIHSELWIGGTPANRWVELTACWAAILLATGLYLWFPRKKAAIWGTLLPRLKRTGRTFWRDMHAVPAFWFSLLILSFIATGLPWSGVLGEEINQWAVKPKYANSFEEKPDSITYTKEIAKNIPWSNENLPVPVSSKGNYVPLGIDQIEEIAKQQKIKKPYTISFPENAEGVYTLSHSEHPTKLATIHVDQYSGAILSDVRFRDFGWLAQWIEVGIAFHEGRLFGLTNQILGLIVCIGIVGIVISSYIMWWKRRTTGKLGAPARSLDRNKTRIVFFLMLGFGLVMPLVGISILGVFLLDYFVISRWIPLTRWFG